MAEQSLFGETSPVKRPKRLKATDDEVRESYARTQSIYASAKEFGMRPSSFHDRLVRLGIPRSAKPISDDERRQIVELYQRGFVAGDGQLEALYGPAHRPRLVAPARAGRHDS